MDLSKLNEAIDQVFAYGPSQKDGAKKPKKRADEKPSGKPEPIKGVTKHDD